MQGKQLIQMDLKLIGRDRFMLFLLGFIVYLGVMLRFLLPWLSGYLQSQGILPGTRVTQSLEQMYPMLVAYLGIFDGALLIGTILGFMLIDERDNNTLLALSVTPMPISRYLRHKCTVAVVLGFFAILGLFLMINQAMLPWWQLMLISAAGALSAPLTALFYAAFAADKVQGFALTKFTGIGGLLIPAVWFLEEGWHWLFCLFPPFWFTKAFWMAHQNHTWWWLVLVGGVVVHVLGIWGLSKILSKTIR